MYPLYTMLPFLSESLMSNEEDTEIKVNYNSQPLDVPSEDQAINVYFNRWEHVLMASG